MNQPTDPPAEHAAQVLLDAVKVACNFYAYHWQIPKLRTAIIEHEAVRGALATPCQHGSEQSEANELRRKVMHYRAEASEERNNVALLAAELAGARKATEEAQTELFVWKRGCEQGAISMAHDLKETIKAEDELAAELRRAVDALRQLITPGVYEPSEEQTARSIVAAYDAKHRNVCNIE